MSWTEQLLSVSGFLYNPSGLMKYEQLLIIGWMINVMWRWSRLLSVDSVCVWLITFCAVCPEILNLFKVVFCVVCWLMPSELRGLSLWCFHSWENSDSEALKHRGAVVGLQQPFCMFQSIYYKSQIYSLLTRLKWMTDWLSGSYTVRGLKTCNDEIF